MAKVHMKRLAHQSSQTKYPRLKNRNKKHMYHLRSLTRASAGSLSSSTFAASTFVTSSRRYTTGGFFSQITSSRPGGLGGADDVPSSEFHRGVREHFWRPVNAHAASANKDGTPPVGDDVARYHMLEHMQSMMDGSIVPPPRFMWAGLSTDEPRIVEDFLYFFTTGFDIKRVEVADDDNCHFVVNHRRSFLGWKPAANQLQETASPSGSVEGKSKAVEPSIIIPFNMELTAMPRPRNTFQTVRFTWDLGAALRRAASAGLVSKPPPEVQECLEDMEAIQMVIALRKAGVKSDVISWRALKSATKKQSKWASALGVY